MQPGPAVGTSTSAARAGQGGDRMLAFLLLAPGMLGGLMALQRLERWVDRV
jgi:hypothetical protein